MTELIDIGANLTHRFFINILETLHRATLNGVKTIIITGTTVGGSEKAQSICRQHNQYNLFFTVGIHPHDAVTYRDLESLRKLAQDPKCVAIGECGLDYDRNFSPREKQIVCFEEQIKLAIELKKPLFLHERAAHSEFIKILGRYKDQIKGRAVVHCFTGGKKEMTEYLKIGLYIGVTGWICDDRRNEELIEALSIIPLDRLMVETDSPFLSPVRGKRNTPAYLKYVVERIAKVLGLTYEHLADHTTKNAIKFFDLTR